MDDLLDPLGDRVMKNVPPISRHPLKRDLLWHNSRKYTFYEVQADIDTPLGAHRYLIPVYNK